MVQQINNQKRTLYSVCIATYKRQELLKQLIESLFNQNLPPEVEIEIIVVDNDPEKTAEKIVRSFAEKNIFEIRYYLQEIKNISLTRNMAVANASGEYILFIDDDEIADENWICSLIAAQKKYNADGVFGTVLSRFDKGVPESIRTSEIFNRPSPPTGSEAMFMRSGNCLIKSSLLKNTPGPFAEEYGLTGGSDTHLFGQLKKQGARFITSAEAKVSEYIPPERANLKYLFLRSLRTGNNYTRRLIEFTENGRLIKRIMYTLKAVVFELVSLVMFIMTAPIQKLRMHWYIKIASNLGHILGAWGIYFNVY